MTGYILKRLLAAIPVLIGLSIIVFLIMALIPGDPAQAILGNFATPENVARVNRELGLDKSLPEQYFIWIFNVLQGDFGRSYILNRPVLDEIAAEYDGKLKVCKVDVDANPEIPPKFGIRGIPTLIVFKGGNAEATKVGALSKTQLTEFVQEVI